MAEVRTRVPPPSTFLKRRLKLVFPATDVKPEVEFSLGKVENFYTFWERTVR